MITCQSNNTSVPLLNGNIMLAMTGVWTTGTLVIDTGDASNFVAGTPASIVDDNGLTFNGTISPDRVGVFIDTVHLRIIGGAYGMWKQPTPKQFNKCSLNDVLSSLNSDSGETLSDTIDQSLLQTRLSGWTIFADRVSTALEEILTFIDPMNNWRILPDGKLWIGKEQWKSQQDNNSVLLEQNPTEQTTLLGPQNLTFGCGVSLSNSTTTIGNIARIQYAITTSSIRAMVWNDIDNGRGLAPSQQAVIDLYTDRFRFLGLYLGNVISQTSDWRNIDIQSTDSKVPNMSGIPLLSGQYENIVGQQCLFGWIGGQPSQPYAISFINNSGALALALAQKTNTNFNNYQTYINNHTHPYVNVSAPATTSAPTAPLSAPTDVSTQKVFGS